MPAALSSRTDSAVDHLAEVIERHGADAGLLAALGAVPDPRAARGLRHRLETILALATCGVLAGCRSFVALGEWVGNAADDVVAALGISTDQVPSESTIRRTVQRLDGDAMDAVIGSWAARQTEPTAGPRLVAVDGKRIRGSGSAAADPRHLLGAIDHRHGVVLAQSEIGAKTNEIPAFAPLLDTIELTGAVVTADALHAQRSHADYLVLTRGADYLLTVKGNQPGLHAQLVSLPWREVPTTHTDTEQAHGRVTKRSIQVATVQTGILFPHARQAIRITRKTRKSNGKKWSTDTAYAVTSLAPEQVSHADLAAWVQGHWSIENRLHWVRDVTFDEDRSQVRTAGAPRAMASLRNLVISMLRIHGATNVAQALRHHAWNPARAVTLVLTS